MSNPHKEFQYEVAGKSLRDLLCQICEVKIKKGSKISYSGPEIKSSSILACSHNISKSFSLTQLRYDRDQGRDVLDVFINKVFQLGYSVGYENHRESMAGFEDIMENFVNSTLNIKKEK